MCSGVLGQGTNSQVVMQRLWPPANIWPKGGGEVESLMSCAPARTDPEQQGEAMLVGLVSEG